jgi:outer membrane protein OmpA-like peptidoglycan-associated protein
VIQPDPATGEAPIATATDADAQPVEAATEETVTEETSRSSSEDFSNRVNEAASAEGQKKGGLSKLEKALLIGAGAVIVGSIISNNRKVELNSGDRIVVQRADGTYEVLKDDDTLLRQPGSTVRTENFADGSTRTTVTRSDGSKIVTIRDAELRVLRRVRVNTDGSQTVLIDDTETFEPVNVATLPPPAPQPDLNGQTDEAALRAALAREAGFDRSFSLAQIRQIEPVRALVPVIELNAITFETGSAAISPDQAKALSNLGSLIQSYVAENPREVFLIEGHTDAVGSAASNLALSDRRAESVALALTEYFGVPPENLVVQGYGEAFLKVPSEGAERANRRAAARRITDLLQSAQN